MRLSITQKIFLGFSVIILLAVLILLVANPFLNRISRLSSQIVPLEKETLALEKYNEMIQLLENRLELYLVIGSQESKEEVLETLGQLEWLSGRFKAQKDLEGLQPIFEFNTRIGGSTGELVAAISQKKSAYEINLQLLEVLRQIDDFKKAYKELQRRNLQESLNIVTAERVIIGMLLRTFVALEVSIVLFGLLAAWLLSRLITRNLFKLRKATQEITAGNFFTRVHVSGRDEIAQLGDSFNAMIDELRKSTVSRDYLDSIINTMADMLVVVDRDLKIIKANNAVYELLGYRDEELKQEPLSRILAQGQEGLDNRNFVAQLSKGGVINLETMFRGKADKDIPVLLSISAMHDQKGEIACIICTAQDLSAHKRAEEQEKQATELKSKLTSMVSYDLRSRMTAVYTGIYLLLSEKAEAVTAKQKGILDLMQRNTGRLLHLINNFLDFSRLEAGSAEFAIVENDINELVQDIYREMRPLTEGKGLGFNLRLAAGRGICLFDKDKIAQVLVNLVSNAVDFTEKGEIVIATQAQADGMRVEVSDTGAGIEKDDLERIFSSFEQIRIPGDGSGRTTVMGLAICKDIIQRHKGKIWVESHPGKGSSFYFILPAK